MACLHCHRDRPIHARGLCKTCYPHLYQHRPEFLRRYPTVSRAGRPAGRRKLSPDTVRAIRATDLKLDAIGRRYGITATLAGQVRRREIYRDVN